MNAANNAYKIKADPNTMDTYQDYLKNEKNGSRYAGRIWSDKTVLTENLTLDMATDGYDGTIKFNSDFLNVFSTLGSSQAWVGLPPTKTVIVVDNSGSMYSNNTTDWDLTRMSRTIKAVNNSIDYLMRAGSFNEVAVVLFGQGRTNGQHIDSDNTAAVIVPMGHYEVSSDSSQPYSYLDAGWAVKDGTIPESPIKDPSQANTSGGFVYVDKRYVNTYLSVDENIKDTNKGLERYDTYSNGTTNINAGIYVAFDTLLREKTSVQVAGINFNYIPSVVVLSDGAATDMLSGSWNNPNLEAMGFTNDRGNKKASYIKGFEDPKEKLTYDWNMYIDLIDKDGTQTLELVGYGDGKTSEDGKDSTGEGEAKLKEFANEVRSTQAAMMLTTILNSSYMKSAVEKKFKEDCQFFTISVDMADPEENPLPDDEEWFSGTGGYSIYTSPVIMNPNKYFNIDWLKEKGYIKETADLNNLTENDFVYDPYTVGSQIILGINDAVKAYDEFKNKSSSFEYRNKIKTYVVYGEATGLWKDMNDNDGKATINGEEYNATKPIGPSHSNAYFISDRKQVKFENLNPSDSENNPYGISNSDIDFNYVTKSYYTSTKDSVTDTISEAFAQIALDIVSNAFKPVSGVNDIGSENSMTYMDPLGLYTEVKNEAITIDEKTFDMGLLLFGKIHGITKAAIYDYNFNTTHRGSDHNSNDLNQPFTPGWYDKEGNYLETGGSWENGDTYYVDSSIVRTYVPNLLEEGKMTEQQKATVYTLYRFLDEDSDIEVHNPCYKDTNVKYKLSDIRIWVEDTGKFEVENNGAAIDLGFDKAVYINVPVNALPVEVVNIEIGTDGLVKSYNTNLDDKINTTPFRLFYGVGLQDSIFTEDGLDIDLAKVSQEYIKKNKVEDVVYFYSNYYSNTNYDGYITDTRTERTRGDAVFSFSPNNDNRFYIYQNTLPLYSLSEEDSELETNGVYKDVPLLNDESLNEFKEKHQQITDASELSSDKWYYVILDYYLPNEKNSVHVAVSRLGKEFGSGIADGSVEAGSYLAWYNTKDDSWIPFNQNEEKPQGDNWVIATKPGGLRVGDMAQSLKSKTTNTTETAYNYYIPTISQTTGSSTDESEDVIVINSYLGNNGRIEVNDSLLLIAKEITTDTLGEESIDKDRAFEFTLKVDGHEGDYQAIKAHKNPYSNAWQLRVSTIDLLTNNEGFLQNTDNKPYVYTQDGGKYYIYVGENTEIGDTGGKYVFRVYSAADNDNKVTLKRSGMTTYVENAEAIDNSLKSEKNKYKNVDGKNTLGSIDFWIDKVYLIPVETVDGGSWNKQTSGYTSIDEFVVAHLDSMKEGANELSSDYATETAYLTEEIKFGYSASKKPGTRPENWTEEEWNTQEQNVAKFKLKADEGILLSGLKASTNYKITENIEEKDNIDRYYFDHIDINEEASAKIADKTVTGVVTANYIDEVVYTNKYYAPVSLSISKVVEGASADKNKDWEFSVKLTPAEGLVLGEEYEYTTENIEEVASKIPDKIHLAKQEDGSYLGKVSLKHGQTLTINGLPEGTKYSISETDANADGYTTKITGSNEGTLDINNPSATVDFKNIKLSRHKLSISKEIEGEAAEKDKEWTFEITLTTADDITLEGSYKYTGSKEGSIEFTNKEGNTYIGEIKLKANETVTIEGLPERTNYVVSEKEKDQDGYKTYTKKETGILKDNDEEQVKFTNVKYSLHDLTIEKIVSGGAGDKEKSWEFEVVLTPSEDVRFATSYNTSKYTGAIKTEDSTLSLEKEGKTYKGTIFLKSGEKVTIKDIPERTQYSIVEKEANKDEYKTTIKGNSTGTLTKEEETVTFTNQKLSKHNLSISKTIDGALADRERNWTFKITLTPGEEVELLNSYTYDGSKEGSLSLVSEGDAYSGTITLKSDEKVTIHDLPEGTKYKVEETEANTEGYTTKVTGESEGTLNLENNNPQVEFKNIKLSKHSLTISKEVVGTAGNKEQEWNFTIKLTPKEGVTLNDSYPIVTGSTSGTIPSVSNEEVTVNHNSDNTATIKIKLKHGQSITINDLPEKTTYEVEEEEANTDEYITKAIGNVKGTLGSTEGESIKFINKKPSKNDLSISKLVTGGLGDKNKEWTFDIILTPDEDVTLLSEYPLEGIDANNITLEKQSDGSSKGTINIKSGETAIIKNLPENTKYKVEEREANQDQYITIDNGTKEGILDTNKKVEFVNTKLAMYNLTIGKKVYGNLGEKEKEWDFKITLYAPEIKDLASTYSYELSKMDAEEEPKTGTLTLNKVSDHYEVDIKLKDNEKMIIKGLLEDTKYEIVEVEANTNDYETTIEGNANGILSAETSAVIFKNVKYSKHDLKIEGELKGNSTDPNKEWTLDVTIKPDSNANMKDSYVWEDENGEQHQLEFTPNGDGTYSGQLKLKGNSGGTIKDLPYGSEYKIEIEEANQEGYTTTLEQSQGVITENTNVQFINEKNINPPTTLDNIVTYLIVFIVSSVSIALIGVYFKIKIFTKM